MGKEIICDQVLRETNANFHFLPLIDAVGRRGGTAQGGVTLGLERDVLAGERGVLPGGAVRVGLAAAHAGFGVHVCAGLRAYCDTHAHLCASVAALAAMK